MAPSNGLSGRRERTDRDVISIWISKGELLGASVRIHVGLLFELRDESACPLERQVKIIDTEEQKEAVAGSPVIRAHQWGVIVGAPLMEAEQDSCIRIEDLPKVVMGRRASRLTEQRLVPSEAGRHVAYPIGVSFPGRNRRANTKRRASRQPWGRYAKFAISHCWFTDSYRKPGSNRLNA